MERFSGVVIAWPDCDALEVIGASKHLENEHRRSSAMRKGHRPKTTLSYTRFSIVFL